MTSVGIIGGHGKIALKAAKILAGSGASVTSFIRNPDHADEVAATGATAAVLDVENASTDEIAQAIEGLDVLVFSAGAGGGNPDRTYAVDRDAAIRSIDAALAAKVSRYLMVSYFGASVSHGVEPQNSFYAYAESKAEADRYLRTTNLRWTIVAPSALDDTDPEGTILTKSEGAHRPTKVSRADVAGVIAAVIDNDATIGTMIEFTGGDKPITEAITSVP